MRTLVSVAVALMVGVVLAVTSAYALVTVNAPDREIEEQLRSGNTAEQSVIEYGQR